MAIRRSAYDVFARARQARDFAEQGSDLVEVPPEATFGGGPRAAAYGRRELRHPMRPASYLRETLELLAAMAPPCSKRDGATELYVILGGTVLPLPPQGYTVLGTHTPQSPIMTMRRAGARYQLGRPVALVRVGHGPSCARQSARDRARRGPRAGAGRACQTVRPANMWCAP